jgi:hypothetical protein
VCHTRVSLLKKKKTAYDGHSAAAQYLVIVRYSRGAPEPAVRSGPR